MKLIHKLICLICMSALLCIAAPAAMAQTGLLLSLTDCTIDLGGSSSYCYLKMNNAENISAMDYMITYDAENLELVNFFNTGFTSQGDVTLTATKQAAFISRWFLKMDSTVLII